MITKPSENPLYVATDNVEQELLSCPDKLNNINQIEPILKQTNEVFICLTLLPVEYRGKSKISGIKRRRLNESDFLHINENATVEAITVSS